MNHIVNRMALVLFALHQSSYAAAAPGIKEYFSAIEVFEQQKKEANIRHTMPRVADAKTGAVFEILTDEKIFTSRRYTDRDIGALSGVCAKANEVSMSYTLFGLKDQTDKTDDVAAAIVHVQELAVRNIYFFQDEVAKLQAFTIRCLATGLPLIIQSLDSLRPEEFTEIRRNGARQMRDGILGVYYGGLTAASDQRMNEANRLRLLGSLAGTASEFAKALPDYRRREIADLAKSAVQSAPDALRTPLLMIQRSMREATCSSLCKL
jgi:hypothetical protein